jgi:hypothetical protein
MASLGCIAPLLWRDEIIIGGEIAELMKVLKYARGHSLLLMAVLLAVVVASFILVRVGIANFNDSGAGCWMRSEEGSVIAQDQIGQKCTSDIRLMMPASAGGPYTNLSEADASPGTLICTAEASVTSPDSMSLSLS